jgi:hypothetical protein
LWNGVQNRRRITHDIINVIEMPSFQYFLYRREQKKLLGARSGEEGGVASTLAKLNKKFYIRSLLYNSSSDILAAADQNTLSQ